MSCSRATGSAAPNSFSSPSISTDTLRTPETAESSGTSARVSDTTSGSRAKPPAVTTQSAVTPRFIAFSNVLRNEAANTAEALTRATPIISAATVADVRRGARPAFSEASWPGAL